MTARFFAVAQNDIGGVVILNPSTLLRINSVKDLRAKRVTTYEHHRLTFAKRFEIQTVVTEA